MRWCVPLIAPHLHELRPFLTKGDFTPGGFGHALVDALQPADFTVEKIAYSVFYQTRLEYTLRAMDIDILIIGGIVTNGDVASTVRDAHLGNIHTVLLSDGCAAFNDRVHEATLVSLGSLTDAMTCIEAIELVGGTP